MRNAIAATLIALAPLILAGIAHAQPGWTAPGWYQMADTIVGPFVWKGPFTDEDTCKASLPANEDDADYTCEYLSERPSWDE